MAVHATLRTLRRVAVRGTLRSPFTFERLSDVDGDVRSVNSKINSSGFYLKSFTIIRTLIMSGIRCSEDFRYIFIIGFVPHLPLNVLLCRPGNNGPRVVPDAKVSTRPDGHDRERQMLLSSAHRCQFLPCQGRVLGANSA